MDVVLRQVGLTELLPMVRSGQPHNHISYIIRHICLQLGHFKDSGEEAPSAATSVRWEMGSAFEDAVALALAERHAKSDPERFMRPGELEVDGIIGTPDLLDLLDFAIIEVKLTWLSSRQPVDGPKFWKYWVQAMAYAYMMGWNKVYLHVCHINGDYRDSGPIYNVWERNCTHDELVENWLMLKSNHAEMRKKLRQRHRSI